ncbi:MAG TPA: cytochrome c, partial [Verrucomicrobiae bacterium]|nr:cytochrome c [Verrucomicrobiae bacterium]
PGGNEAVILGKRLFEANCALCHNVDGMGKPGQAPPLASSEWVNAVGSYRVIHVPQFGLSGPVTVKGQEYSLSMAPMGAAYSNEELAAVLTYVRQAWGNKAPAVTPEQVAKVRADVAGRTQPYSADELKKLPE